MTRIILSSISHLRDFPGNLASPQVSVDYAAIALEAISLALVDEVFSHLIGVVGDDAARSISEVLRHHDLTFDSCIESKVRDALDNADEG